MALRMSNCQSPQRTPSLPAEDKQVASDQNSSSDKIEPLDEESRGSIQDIASTQEDDQSSNLPKG